MFFCPLDGTLLKVDREEGPHGSTANTFVCTTCPYAAPIRETQSVKTRTKRKEVDDILGGAAAWENVDRTMAICPSCNHPDAYFMQIQIRSADEPMSVFYKCVSCSHQWNDK